MADRDRMVSIRLRMKWLRNKLFSRDAGHGVKHTLVANAAAAELERYHVLAVQCERVGLNMIEHSNITLTTGLDVPLLFSPFAHLYIKTDHAVLVAEPDNRHVAGHVVYHLDDLLCGLRDVRAVGQG